MNFVCRLGKIGFSTPLNSTYLWTISAQPRVLRFRLCLLSSSKYNGDRNRNRTETPIKLDILLSIIFRTSAEDSDSSYLEEKQKKRSNVDCYPID